MEFWIAVGVVVVAAFVLRRALRKMRAPMIDDAARRNIDYTMVQNTIHGMHERNSMPPG